MTAGLRMRERVTACSFATANVSARQAYSRRRVYSALRARCGRDRKPDISLLHMRAFVRVDLFHMASPNT